MAGTCMACLICVFEFLCMSVDTHIPQHVYVEVRGQPQVKTSSSTLFETRSHHLLLHAGWPNSIHRFSYLCLLSCSRSTGNYTRMLSRQALYRFWGSKLRSSCLCDKCFTQTDPSLSSVFVCVRHGLTVKSKLAFKSWSPLQPPPQSQFWGYKHVSQHLRAQKFLINRTNKILMKKYLISYGLSGTRI